MFNVLLTKIALVYDDRTLFNLVLPDSVKFRATIIDSCSLLLIALKGKDY